MNQKRQWFIATVFLQSKIYKILVIELKFNFNIQYQNNIQLFALTG